MNKIFYIKQNDTAPFLDYELTTPGVNLVGASVVFNMKEGDTVIVNRASATVQSTSPPVLRHSWLPAHTARSGVFEGEFEVTYSGGQVETWPNLGFIPIVVTDDIA